MPVASFNNMEQLQKENLAHKSRGQEVNSPLFLKKGSANISPRRHSNIFGASSNRTRLIQQNSGGATSVSQKTVCPQNSVGENKTVSHRMGFFARVGFVRMRAFVSVSRQREEEERNFS